MNEYIGRSMVIAAGGSWAWAFGRPAAADAEQQPPVSGRAARIRGAQAIQGARAARAAAATARAQATARAHAQALQNRAATMLTDTAPGHVPFSAPFPALSPALSPAPSPSAVSPMAPEAGRGV
ncbi:hypothetical protein [Streptomyces shenzhenensis]|uniref:hypothetical protein n=1 Tax=Streptomyces shenzhenensis TaxID=943815 RepID=UPI0015F0C00B|nr:hypothetical protein [Streptomyces shenzhenensis]